VVYGQVSFPKIRTRGVSIPASLERGFEPVKAAIISGVKCRTLYVLACLGLAAGTAAPSRAGRVDGAVVLMDAGKARADASDVVVWIDGLHEGAVPPAAEPEMKSFHKRFEPHVLAVEVGRTVSFPNEDPIFHNVFSVSGRNRFDLGLYRSGRSREKRFSVPGLVRVYCNIHPQMAGYIRVVDSAAFAVTGPDGVFSFRDVPEGRRIVRAWCEAGGETSADVLVGPGSAVHSTLTLDVTGYKPKPHKNKYGKEYPPPPPDEDRY
jgi:plastocyanin